LIEAVQSGEQWQVRARLKCGCEVSLSVPTDRVVESVTGARILVGKYRCPEDHAVQAG
jgi:hypothetical protein